MTQRFRGMTRHRLNDERCRGRATALGLAAAGSLLALGALSGPAAGETFAQAFKHQVIDQAQISGHARVYDFRRWHNGNHPYPREGSGDNVQQDLIGDAIGGDVTVQTGSLYGFSAGTALYLQHRLHDYGVKANNGLNGDFNKIAEGYLQFQQAGVRLRAGREIINTPFANGDMFTMLPRAFYGVSGTFSLFNNFMHRGPQKLKSSSYQISEYMPFSYEPMAATPDAKLYVGRFTRNSNRFSDEWESTNAFGYPTGDNGQSADRNNEAGLFTAGLQYQQQTPVGGLLGEVWYYKFFNIANMGYGEAGYELPQLMSGGPRPFIRAQYMHETDTGGAALGNIDATIYGAKLGLKGSHYSVSLLAEHAPTNKGAFGNGRFVHPYSDLSGIFYDDTMNAGLEDSGPGNAFGVNASATPTDNLKVYARYVWYKSTYGLRGDYYSFGGSYRGVRGFPPASDNDDNILRDEIGQGWGAGFTYDLGGVNANLANLSIGDNVGVTQWHDQPTFIDNRVRLIYTF